MYLFRDWFSFQREHRVYRSVSKETGIPEVSGRKSAVRNQQQRAGMATKSFLNYRNGADERVTRTIDPVKSRIK